MEINCHSCETVIEIGDRYVLEGSGDTHHAECFDEFADDDYRYKFNDHAYHIRKL